MAGNSRAQKEQSNTEREEKDHRRHDDSNQRRHRYVCVCAINNSFHNFVTQITLD